MPKVFDAYSFPARVVPVLVVVLPPVVLLGVGLISEARLGVATGAVVTVLAAIAGQLGRDRGKRLETELWNEWGGAPTLQRLRHRSGGAPIVVERLHQRVERVLQDPMPTSAEEAAAPAEADAQYTDATRRLIALTRNQETFATLFAENVNYGLRRNLLGLKPIGITVAVMTVAIASLLLLVGAGSSADRSARFLPAICVALAVTAFWILVVRRQWVRVPAEAYADRLMESVETLAAGKERT